MKAQRAVTQDGAAAVVVQEAKIRVVAGLEENGQLVVPCIMRVFAGRKRNGGGKKR